MAIQKQEKSCEERVEDSVKRFLDSNKIHYYTKTQSINEEINYALERYPSKRGGEGKNYPDIKLFLNTSTLRKIPVMIECKGIKGRLAKFASTKTTNTKSEKGVNIERELENTTKEGKPHFSNISNYALNGAVHYANAILDYTQSYDEVIAIGINGYDESGLKLEYAFYYLNRKNLSYPKKIGDFSDLSCLSKEHLSEFISKIDTLTLNEKEQEKITLDLENDTEIKLNSLNQFLHDDLAINANDRVALLVGMIMAAQGVKDKVAPLKISELTGEQGDKTNDGQKFLSKIDDFLTQKALPKEKIESILNELRRVFISSNLWHTSKGVDLLHIDESSLKRVYIEICDNILPLVQKLKKADIAGRLFNSLTKWLKVPDGEANDVVLTPRYIVDLMVKLANVNKDSFVWDYATGSGAFLISAMNAMIKDAEQSLAHSPKEREAKIAHIKAFQLLGIEKRVDIYLLGILNMILLNDGSANFLHKDSLHFGGAYEQGDKKGEHFPANVFLLNPPYSAKGKGLVFVKKALDKMQSGRACIIIQENAGEGQDEGYGKEILKNNTLLASIKMPKDLFIGKSSVQTAIYLFEVGTPHRKDKLVKFIDFSIDGYKKTAKKKAKASANLKDTDNAKARYKELVDRVLGNKIQSNYYDECVIEDCISLDGQDWTYSKHKKIDSKPTLQDFKKTVGDYLAWEVSQILTKDSL